MVSTDIFRYDIAGLRAWAVLFVVLYHFNIPGFKGGFIGVDVFFVISGFLMTQIIMRDLYLNTFSIWKFYLSRIKRIVPALLVLCAGLLISGWFVLPPADYKSLGVHIFSSVLFLSNFQYWREAGYFDVDSHDKWLLHTWSLSVEWQFYIFYPILLLGTWRLFSSRLSVKGVLYILFLVSFIYSIRLTSVMPETAFFLLPSRAWEMLTGAFVALYIEKYAQRGTHIRSRVLEGVGIGFLTISVITAQPNQWPGSAALIPVLGTSLILLAQRNKSIFTTQPILQCLGNWSYSIYLWHWPIVVATAYIGLQNNTAIVVVGLILSLLLGWVSYRWVEPLGRNRLLQRNAKISISVFVLFVLMLLVSSLVIRFLNGVPGRLGAEVEAIAATAYDYNPQRDQSHSMSGIEFKKYVYGGSNIRAIVLGDRHASTVVTAVKAALENPQDGVLGMSYTSCPTVLGVHHERHDLFCDKFNEWAKLQIDALPAHIPLVIVNRSSAYIYGLKFGSVNINPLIYFDADMKSNEHWASHFVKEYSDKLSILACRLSVNRPVFYLRPLPEMPIDVPRAMARAAQLGRTIDISMPIDVYNKRNSVVWEIQDHAARECGINILNPLPALCEDSICRAADGLVPRYYDDNHLTESGSRLLVPLFKTIFH